jgi:hypothetical protein
MNEQQEIEDILTKAGLKKNSGCLSDYGTAMRVLCNGKIIDHDKYERMVKVVTKFLNV